MRFDVVTLFPELFGPMLTVGITRRAFESGQVEVHLHNPRDFADGNYRRVDDRPSVLQTFNWYAKTKRLWFFFLQRARCWIILVWCIGPKVPERY